MIETIWDRTSQQLPKLANNQNLTTKPLQIPSGTNASLRTKLPNIFFKSFLSPIHLLTKCWQQAGSQNFELQKGSGMNWSRSSQIREPGRYHPLGDGYRSESGEVGVWKNICCCNCIAGAGERFCFPRTKHTKKHWKSPWLVERCLHFLYQAGHFWWRDTPGSWEVKEVMCRILMLSEENIVEELIKSNLLFLHI